MTLREYYDSMLSSGVFFEFFPDLTGDFDDDKFKFFSLIPEIDKSKIPKEAFVDFPEIGEKGYKEFIRLTREQWKDQD